MPNIMLTYRCNLHCPYCFANEYVNQFSTDITEEDFDRAVEFIVRGGCHQIGLIGGEPTLHPKFERYIKKMSQIRQISSIMLYTNGMMLEKLENLYMDYNITSILKILVNCNSPEQLGEAGYQRLIDSLDRAFTVYHMQQNIKFGINLYDNNFDYSYIMEILQRYGQHQVRISLTVPDFGTSPNLRPLDEFRRRKGYLLQFLRDMDTIGVLAYMDCNLIPSCIWTEGEKAWLRDYAQRYSKYPTNLLDEAAVCSPVIDIMPDMQAVRCFGMSSFEEVPIGDFTDIREMNDYFIQKVDCSMCAIPADSSCLTCRKREAGKCTGGCPGYKQDKIRKVNSFRESL